MAKPGRAALPIFILAIIAATTLPLSVHLVSHQHPHSSYPYTHPKKQPTLHLQSIFFYVFSLQKSVNPTENMQMNHFCSWLFAF